MAVNLAENSDYVYDQFAPEGTSEQSVSTLPSGTIFVSLINGLSGSVSFSGGTTGYSFSPSGSTVTLTVTPATARAALLVKAQRVSTGSIAASSTADVTLTWAAAFADANYTPIASVLEAGANLEIVGIKSYSASAVVVTIRNTDASDHTGTLLLQAIHD